MKTVLIANGALPVPDRFGDALESAGHRTIRVRTAAELLARLRAEGSGIDLALLDLRLPQSGGIGLIRTIRELDDGGLPILVFSGSVSSAQQVRELAALGVAGYVNEHCAAPQILPALAPHLFPDNFNRRGSPRVPLGVPVRYHAGDTIAAAVSLNVSKGGLGIRTIRPLGTSTKVRVQFRIPGDDRDVEADSRVAWSDRRAGMGLQFERLDPRDQTAIDEFVDRHARRPRRLQSG